MSESPRSRVHPSFERLINRIQIGRINSKKDKPTKPASAPRLTLAITRHPLIVDIEKDIIKADLTDRELMRQIKSRRLMK